MRWRIDGCICKPGMAPGETHCGSNDSLLGRNWPPTGRAVKTIENSCRTSPLLVRRCELAGVCIDGLDFEAGTLMLETMRDVVDGQVVQPDGKTEHAQRLVVLDPFTLALLRTHVEMLDQERAEFGPEHRHE